MTEPTTKRGKYPRRLISLGPPYDDGTPANPEEELTPAEQKIIDLVETLAGWTTAAELVADLRPLIIAARVR